MRYQITTATEIITVDAKINKWGEVRWSFMGMDHMMNIRDQVKTDSGYKPAPSLLERLQKVAKRMGGKVKILDLADGYQGNRKLRY